MKRSILLFFPLLLASWTFSQNLALPDPGTNYKCRTGRRVGVTDIDITWNAPGVKGREGKIWGTTVAHYGFQVLGFGSTVESPWRAGADENTTIAFSTDVTINGKPLSAGKYGFFIALYPDSCVLIFSRNTSGWGSYFYHPEWDVLRVSTKQQKDQPQSVERLAYTFSDQTDKGVTAALEWERWRIPFRIEMDPVKTGLAAIRAQMSGALGFDPPSLQTAAQWCLDHNVNTEEALGWINNATDPALGGLKTFNALSVKSGLLEKTGKHAEAEATMKSALDNATVLELHTYGRKLIGDKKYQEAMDVFQKNFQRFGDVWPVHVGLMRGYSATGDLKKALEHAKIALGQAPDEGNRRSLEAMVKTLSDGKAIAQ